MMRVAFTPCAMVARPSKAAVPSTPAKEAPTPSPVRSSSVASPMASEKIKVQRDRILVKPISSSKPSPGGLLLGSPAKTATDAHFGEVVAMGEKVTLELSKGDAIMYQRIGACEFHIDEEPHEFVPQMSVIGLVN